jgi:membrane protease YdiL (CAAX protease family)
MNTRWGVILGPSALAAAGLALAAASPRGGPLFFTATFAVAAVYIAAWALWGRGKPLVQQGRAWQDAGRGVLVGAALMGLFLAGAAVVHFIPPLAAPVHSLLENARMGGLPLTILTTAVNGIGEELYFRRVLPLNIAGTVRVRVVVSVLIYIAVTAALGVPLLAVAALAVGLAALWQARVTGGLLSPVVLHLTWSMGMLFLLPLVI